MLDIRGLTWFAWSWTERINPFFYMRQLPRIRAKGALANWLHNLAQFSALEFERFEEDRFWTEYEYLARTHGKYWAYDYRKFFDERKVEFKNERGT
tara:strand:+ start:247 stop:534 length:288 start_codon:yes stop_codon:yes gene_type:complete